MISIRRKTAMKRYIAIIGDIRYSKNIQDRGNIQRKLNKILNALNENYGSDIAAKFVITLGDEFQVLLHNGDHLLEMIRAIQRQLYPVEVRFGIGIGDITTPIKKTAAIGADGPAYYAAREMIDELRIMEKKLKHPAPDVKVGYYEQKDDLELEHLNAFFRLNKLIDNSWSDEQRATVMEAISNNDSQSEIARRLGTTQSTVARRLAMANFITYMDIEDIINKTIVEITR